MCQIEKFNGTREAGINSLFLLQFQGVVKLLPLAMKMGVLGWEKWG